MDKITFQSILINFLIVAAGTMLIHRIEPLRKIIIGR